MKFGSALDIGPGYAGDKIARLEKRLDLFKAELETLADEIESREGVFASYKGAL